MLSSLIAKSFTNLYCVSNGILPVMRPILPSHKSQPVAVAVGAAGTRNKHSVGGRRIVYCRGLDPWWKRQWIKSQTWHHYIRRQNCYRIAIRSVQKAWVQMRANRLHEKSSAKLLWAQRIGAACEEHDATRKDMVAGLSMCNVRLNAKMLAEFAVNEPKTFKGLLDLSLLRKSDGLMPRDAEALVDTYTRGYSDLQQHKYNREQREPGTLGREYKLWGPKQFPLYIKKKM